MTQITKVIGRVQLRGGTTANANSKNEVLLDRELFIEKNKGIKVGDGVTPYSGLDYAVDFTQTSLPEGGGNIKGTNYIFVQANGTPEENYQEFLDAYNEIITRFPSPDADTNYGLILAPGIYTGAPVTINRSYIFITSLTGEPDVVFTNRINVNGYAGVVNGVIIKGIKCTYNSYNSIDGYGPLGQGSSAERTTFINCIGKDYSFGISDRNPVKYINCKGGDYSFSGSEDFTSNSLISGCKAGNNSFYAIAHYGLIKDTIAGDNSFNSQEGSKGEMINVKAGDNSFKATSEGGHRGLFVNCEAGDDSFIGQETISHSTFKNCKAGNGSFKTIDGGGIIDTLFENCSAGDNSFWSEDNLRAEFRNCVAGNISFVGNNNEIEETTLFYNCKAGNYSFRGMANADNKGQFYNCIAGFGSFGGAIVSGRFENCKGDNKSFGHKEFVKGTFINCIAGDESFGSGDEQGIDERALFQNCVAGDYSFGNLNNRQKGTFINCIAGSSSFGEGSMNHTANYFNCVCLGDYAGFSDTSGVALNCIVNNQIVV